MKNNSIKYRIPVCIFLFVSGTIISILFSNALNDMIVYGRLTTQLTDPGALIGNIFTLDKLGQLFLLLEALVVLICIVYFVCAKRTYQADTYAVTDNLSIPVPYGQGQHGTTWFMSKKEKKEVFPMKRVFSCVVAASLALSLLAGCGASSAASSAASGAASSEAASSVASSAVETAALPDGVYTADFDTDSSMFHANEACNGKGTLTVENGQMTFHVSLASTHIVNLYLGKAADAAANASDWLQPTTDTVTYSDGTSEEVYGFDIPVSAVDADFDLAILGTKGKWYDHVVSVRNAVQQAGTAAPADGTYTCDVTLEGGSGRATVESPAALTVADGKMTATIVWSSPNYDYMLVDGEKYLPTNTEGNSTFEIPVAALDTALDVTADTVAMSTPHEIEYTLTFDSASLK